MIICLIRTGILYFTIVIALRIMGKRQLGELGPGELVAAVMISDLATTPMQDPGIPLLYGIIPVLTLLSLEMLLSEIASHSARFRELLSGKPCMVIENGVINQKAMRKNRYTPDDLQESLRQNGITDIMTVMSGVLEPDGTLSILLKPEEMPVTLKDLKITPPTLSYPMTIICDGRLLSNNLHLLGKDRSWLNSILKQHGADAIEKVYLLTADSAGNIFYAEKE